MTVLVVGTILDTVQGFVDVGGYYVIFGLLFACGLGLPLPEDVPLIIGGYFAASGHMDLVVLAVVAWCGIIGGDCVLYYLGRKYGLNITRVPFIGKHVSTDRIKQAEVLFDNWGIWVVGVGRMIAGVRGAMVLAAGTIRYNFAKFIIADGLAAIVSGGLFVALGYWAETKFGDLNELRRKIKGIEHWVILAVLLIIAVLVFLNWSRRKKHKPPLVEKVLEKAAEKAIEHPIIKHPPVDRSL